MAGDINDRAASGVDGWTEREEVGERDAAELASHTSDSATPQSLGAHARSNGLTDFLTSRVALRSCKGGKSTVVQFEEDRKIPGGPLVRD